jgi:hypothetical protein
MPADYVIDLEHRLVRTTLSGVVTGPELRALRERLAADPLFSPEMSGLIDLTDARSPALTTADIRELASSAIFSRGARRAFVSPTPAMFGLARMFEAYREMRDGPNRTATFRTVAEAEAWLALD